MIGLGRKAVHPTNLVRAWPWHLPTSSMSGSSSSVGGVIVVPVGSSAVSVLWRKHLVLHRGVKVLGTIPARETQVVGYLGNLDGDFLRNLADLG